MSRFEGKIEGDDETPVEAAEILAALAREAKAGPERRQDAVSRYFSASDGWREASTILGGAFAADARGLKGAKGE